jgi:ribosome-binding factor A
MKPRTGRRSEKPVIFDDGVDPLRKEVASGRSHDRKTLQLCARVAEVLNLSLSGDGQDELLIGWQVDHVIPVQRASLLMAVVAPIDPDDRTPASAVLARLEAAKPRLRVEIARAVQRRKTPDLMFQIVRPGQEAME